MLKDLGNSFRGLLRCFRGKQKRQKTDFYVAGIDFFELVCYNERVGKSLTYENNAHQGLKN